MDRKFPGSYGPTAADIEQIWRSGIVAADASVLLNICTYSPKTRDQFLEALERVADRKQLWIPFQALKEFHRNRLRVIDEQDELLHEILSAFNGPVAFLKPHNKKRNKVEWRHPYIEHGDLTELVGFADEAKRKADTVRDRAKRRRINPLDDPHLKRLTGIIGNAFGIQPTLEELEVLKEQWAIRAKHSIPPGFEDIDKHDGGIGDFLIWSELLEQAKSSGQPIVFVTEDDKPDWWIKHNPRLAGLVHNQTTSWERVK